MNYDNKNYFFLKIKQNFFLILLLYSLKHHPYILSKLELFLCVAALSHSIPEPQSTTKEHPKPHIRNRTTMILHTLSYNGFCPARQKIDFHVENY